MIVFPKRLHIFSREHPIRLALVLGSIAGVLAFAAIKKQELEVRRGWNLVPVLTARIDLDVGSVVTEDTLERTSIPEQFVTPSVVQPGDLSKILNARLLVPLQKNDPLLWTQFETHRTGERLSAKVQRKARALTLQTDPESAVGGWVRPNDHVDVIGTFREPTNNESVSVTLLENVIVLATGKQTGLTKAQHLSDAQRDYSHVTLLVMPEEAEILALARDLGKLTLALRNDDDIDVLSERGRADIRTLLSGQRTSALHEKRMRTIQIIRGTGAGSDTR
jgi:pilus assembly protein CpaB